MVLTLDHPAADLRAAAIVVPAPLPTAPVTRAPDGLAIEGAAAAGPSLEDLIARHGAEIWRFARRLTGNAPDADDLYQETMLRAFRALGRLGAAANHRAWLYRIAANTFYTERRKRQRIDRLDELAQDHLCAPEPDRAAGLDARALLDEVAAFVDGLPPKQRIALILRKHHGLGYAEIGLAIACSEGAARSNVHEALRKLHARFAERL